MKPFNCNTFLWTTNQQSYWSNKLSFISIIICPMCRNDLARDPNSQIMLHIADTADQTELFITTFWISSEDAWKQWRIVPDISSMIILQSNKLICWNIHHQQKGQKWILSLQMPNWQDGKFPLLAITEEIRGHFSYNGEGKLKLSRRLQDKLYRVCTVTDLSVVR